jgi:Fur family ferric uptake transcriptional regulator
MSSSVDDLTHRDISAMLARTEHRYTTGRRTLVEVLGAAGRPITLPDVLAADASLSQSSVYRNLDILERAGVIHRLSTGGEYTYFELAEPLLGHHHHLICVGCGLVQDVALDDKVERVVDDALASVAAEVDFAPLHHSLDLHGHCAECR